MTPESNTPNYEQLFELSSSSILVTLEDKKVIFSNLNFLDTLELPKDQVINHDVSHFLEFKESQLTQLKMCSLGKIAFEETVLCRHRNGEYSEFFVIAKKVKLMSNDVYYFEILTKLKAVEPSAQSLEILGEITSKIAHDISNPLAILKIHGDIFNTLLSKNTSLSPEDTINRIEKITRATDRVITTTKDLKSFAKLLLSNDEVEIQKIWKNFKIPK